MNRLTLMTLQYYRSSFVYVQRSKRKLDRYNNYHRHWFAVGRISACMSNLIEMKLVTRLYVTGVGGNAGWSTWLMLYQLARPLPKTAYAVAYDDGTT